MQNNLKRYSLMLWHWAWLIALGTALAAAAAYIASRLTQPVYAASTTLLVDQAPSGRAADYASILTSQQLAQTYSAMLTKRPVLDEVVATLNLNMSSDVLASHVNTTLIRNTELIQLDVEDSDPTTAAAIANLIPTVFGRRNSDLQTARYADSKNNLSKQMDSLKQQIDQKQSEVSAIGSPDSAAKDAELARLQSDLTQLRQSSAYLLQSYEAIRLAEAQSTSNIVVVEPAQVPTGPVRPRIVQNTILGGIVGMLLAIGVVMLIEYLDDRVRSLDQIDQLVSLPVIGLIAKMRTDQTSTLVTLREPRSPIAEAFRSLRTNIQFAGVDRPVQTLLVTSASPSEGKSTVAANLAVVMAQAGMRVALLDGDLRRPTVHKFFEHTDRTGLTDIMLQDPAQWNGVTQPSNVSNLATLVSGPLPPNPSELLGSKRMRQLIAHLHESYDMVIIDAPPLLPVTDALVLSTLADAVILVVSTGVTRIGELVQSKLQLDQAGARVIGAVMNMIPIRRGRYAYYHYQHYYDDAAHDHRQRSKLKSPQRQLTEPAVSEASVDSRAEAH